MKNIIIHQSKAKIGALFISLFAISAPVASAISCILYGPINILHFAEKSAHFAILNAYAFTPIFALILFYERQFMAILPEGLRIRIRAGDVREIPFEQIVDVKRTRVGIKIIVQDKPNIRIDSWRYKKSDLKKTHILLQQHCKRCT